MENHGDMPIEDFRSNAHKLVDWMADYIKDIEKFPVLGNVKPGDIKSKLPMHPPIKGEDMDSVFRDVDDIVVPGMNHWNHPAFMAYFNSTSSGPGIMGEMLSAVFNTNGMIWKSCPSSTELEEVVLKWLREMIGLPDDFFGIVYDTASISTFHAVAAAREYADPLIREKGFAHPGNKSMILYCSEHAHSSVEKAAITLGTGLEGIRKIQCDENFSMIPEKLEEAIQTDKKNGLLPMCVVASVGTTSSTAIDPVKKIAAICKKENVWLHVDAAHAGTAAIVPEMKFLIDGCDQADSFVVNPHKWMSVPIDFSVLYIKKPGLLKRSFSLVPDYLKTAEERVVINYMDYGLQLGRRFRSLKLWFIIRYFGVEGIINNLRENLRIGKEFSKWIDEHKVFERLAPVPLSTICFRAVPPNMTDEKEINSFNEKLFEAINATGKVFLSQTKLNGRFTIRVVFSGIRTEEKHAGILEEVLDTELEKLI